AAVAPNGLRVAFIHRTSNANEVWGYDVGLRASYLLVLDSAPVSSVSWDPAGKRIAYLRHDLSATSLRVRNLTGAAATSTITSGQRAPRPAPPHPASRFLAAAVATHRDAAEGVRGQRGLAALGPQSYDRDSCRSRHRGRVAGLIARWTSDRVSQRRSGLADERGRHAPDRVDQRGPCLFSLFLPRACVDADLSSLDACVEQLLT